MIKKIKSDQSIYCESRDASPQPLHRRIFSTPCLARYGRVIVQDPNKERRHRRMSSDPPTFNVNNVIETKAKFIIFIALSVANQSFVGNALSFYDASLQIKTCTEDNTDLVAIIKDVSIRIAVDVLLYNMIGGNDAFHYAMYLFFSEHTKGILDMHKK